MSPSKPSAKTVGVVAALGESDGEAVVRRGADDAAIEAAGGGCRQFVQGVRWADDRRLSRSKGEVGRICRVGHTSTTNAPFGAESTTPRRYLAMWSLCSCGIHVNKLIVSVLCKKQSIVTRNETKCRIVL
jgi:hypothetical protein